MNKMVAWGQYIHWANIQYEYRKQLDEDCSGAIFIRLIEEEFKRLMFEVKNV